MAQTDEAEESDYVGCAVDAAEVACQKGGAGDLPAALGFGLAAIAYGLLALGDALSRST